MASKRKGTGARGGRAAGARALTFGATGELLARVEAATVRLTRRGGQGVLVPGRFILTATHCIHWEADGGMPLGDHYLEPVETKNGRTFNVAPVAVEVVADIAVLGELDNQEFADDCAAFDQWRDRTEAVRLSDLFTMWNDSIDDDGNDRSFPVYVLTHTGEWIAGHAKRFGFQDIWTGAIHVRFERPIVGGTSGGPIVDDVGQLVGVVSFTNVVGDDRPCDGMQPIAAYALPHWVLQRIARGDARV